jgi:methanethiol S-methyltransferase
MAATTIRRPAMTRILYVLFAFVSYAIFFATFLYLIAFVGDLPFAAGTVDRGGLSLGTGAAVVVDLALIAMFGVQHSVMARQGFKRAWTKIVPPTVERSVYVLASSLTLIIFFAFWAPIPQVIWSVSGPAAYIIRAIFALGWGMVLLSTFLINHFELFGLQQVWLNLRNRAAAAPQFHTPLLYRLVRHPLYLGFVLAFWATPVMTVGHLVLAAGMTVYIIVAIGYEERDLIGLFGDQYADYRRRVGMLIPGLGRRR